MIRISRSFRRNERGAAMVEFAIVLPLLLLLVMGIIEFSLLFFDKAVITNASREGAREGIVYRYDPVAGADARLTTAEITDVVTAYCKNYLITFGSMPSPTVKTYVNSAIDDSSNAVSGDEVRVEVSYQYDFLVFPNIVAGLFNGSMASGINLVATTTMRAE